MKRVVVFLALTIAALLGPLLAASALSAIGGIGPIELTIIYLACIVAAVLTWRSFRRKQAAAEVSGVVVASMSGNETHVRLVKSG